MKHKKHQLRQQMRQQRQALTLDEQEHATQAVLEQLLSLKELKQAQRIAAYVANNGELNPQPILSYAWQHNINTYLPVLPNDKSRLLHFIQVKPDDELIANRFGIAEPTYSPQRQIEAHQLDIVFVPLLAFDQRCHRLGMGGGYYDATFSFLNTTNSNKPMMIGLAHDFQVCERLPSGLHDVPLDRVITEVKIYFPNEPDK